MNLGYEKGDALSDMVEKFNDFPISKHYFDLFDQVWFGTIPLEQFRSYTEYKRITHIPVMLRNFFSTARLVVVELTVEGERFLFGYLTNDEEMKDEQIAELYPTRWDSVF